MAPDDVRDMELVDRVRRETASQIRDVLRRIGPACTLEWIREQLDRIANQLEFHAKTA